MNEKRKHFAKNNLLRKLENPVHMLYKGGIKLQEMEKRVWQRVMQQTQPENTALKSLAIESQEAMTEYRQLLKAKVESVREVGRQLLKAEQENMACLRGLHYLQTGEQMKVSMGNLFPVDLKRMVRRYHRARRQLMEYTARSAEPEWGCVFQAMAKRQEGQCDRLCQLVGYMK